MINYDNAALRCNFVWSSNLMMKEYMGIDVSAATMDKIISLKFDDEWAIFTYDPNSSDMDTAARDDVADAVSMFFLNQPWPRYCDNVEISVFVETLQKAIDNHSESV